MTIRDVDKFKDKIEVTLDSRQVFFLFFGGAVVASLIFVLGVMVGKRLEGRERVARRATTSASIDPLAALDELAQDEAEAQGDILAFPVALTKPDKSKPLGSADVAPPVPPPSAKPPPPPAPAQPSAAKVAEVPAPAASQTPPSAKDPARVPAKTPAVPVKPASASPEKVQTQAQSKKVPAKFTLQLSSFQEKAEADSFVAKLQSSGYRPYVVQGEVEGRGTFYRVRVGHFVTYDEAMAAKGEFEKRQHIIAYVTRL
ncbi:MAG: SPOR domain-containing protein [Deltaproteobacteria bacterium]|nr:SPOR domain-containing protein [Deltaproteobacteria bacterium]